MSKNPLPAAGVSQENLTRLPDKNWRVLFRWRWGGVGLLTLGESRGDAIGRAYNLLYSWLRDELSGLDELWIEKVRGTDQDGYPRFEIDAPLSLARVRDIKRRSPRNV